MGLDRWQIAIQTSSGMGSSGMMITSNEVVPFFEVEVPLVGKSGARKVVEKGEKQGASGEEGRGGTYEVQLPMMKDGQVLPSYKKQEEDISEWCGRPLSRARTHVVLSWSGCNLHARALGDSQGHVQIQRQVRTQSAAPSPPN